MPLDVGEPGVDRARYADRGGIACRELLPPHLTQLGVVALEQAPVQLEL